MIQKKTMKIHDRDGKFLYEVKQDIEVKECELCMGKRDDQIHLCSKCNGCGYVELTNDDVC